MDTSALENFDKHNFDVALLNLELASAALYDNRCEKNSDKLSRKELHLATMLL